MIDRDLAREKWEQAQRLLDQLDLDAWLIVVRETSVQTDPVLALLGGFDVVWESYFLLRRDGERVAIVGRYDALPIEGTGLFQRIIPYDEDLAPALREVLAAWNPATIALDYSPDNVVADGLSHGLWLALQQHLRDTPFPERFVPADPLVSRLRAVKTSGERVRLEAAVRTAERFWAELRAWLRPGLTERAIWEWTQAWLDERGLGCAWPCDLMPTVHAGPVPVGHTTAGDAVWEPGSVLHVDFGLVQDGFCTDQQRIFYALRPDEDHPPIDLLDVVGAVVGAIEAAAVALRAGVAGWEVDQVARSWLVDLAGYPEFKHALGHTVGRAVHDGGVLLGPRWPRYGTLPLQTVEPDEVFTLELGVATPYGYIGIEEEAVVTAAGARFLSPPQTELIVVAGSREQG
ncbi:MAG: M24 family metallopeptidase [Ardenticatenaceae bacterium]|nr:M24 family metallopeptidase [Ardenticatenaceae bacterium]